MRAYTRKVLLLLALCSSFFAKATDEDKNIIIESKTQVFKFWKGKKDNPVVISEELSVKYRCSEVRTNILFSEMYNDLESIDEVTIYIEGKKNKLIVPKYEYYSVKDIFYSDARVYFFPLPFEKKGATAEVKMEKTHKDPRYLTRVFLTDEYFIENKVIQFIVPRWMKTELKELNFNSHNIKKTVEYNSKDEADIYTFTITNLKPFKSEYAAPGASYIYPHILVLNKEANLDGVNYTYFKTIADQYKWGYGLVKQVEDDNAALATKAKELTNGINGDINKVKTIYNWVQNNIRYIAYEDGIAAFKPAKAMDVLNKKYGDCKGMANLIKGLLKGIGLDARICWIGTKHIAYDLSTPTLSVHNHMIAALIYGGKTYFLDGTETNIGFNEYAERIAGRQVLVEDGEKYILTNIPTVNYKQNIGKEKRTLELKNNLLIGTATHTYSGEAKSSLLSKIQSIKKDNTEKALTRFLTSGNEDYAIANLLSNHTSITDSLLNISYNINFKNGVSAFGNEVYLEVDYRKDLDGFIIDTAKRNNDRELDYQETLDYETEITLPTNYKVTTQPTDWSADLPNAQFSITYKLQGNKLLYKRTILIKNTLLKKENFAQWNTTINQLSNKYKEQVVLSN